LENHFGFTVDYSVDEDLFKIEENGSFGGVFGKVMRGKNII